jgi:P4 family phage/plasmid primase-like protien
MENNNKKNQSSQDATDLQLINGVAGATDDESKVSCTPVAPQLHPSCTPVAPPISPTEYRGKHFYTAQKVAKILGVTRQAVEKWRNQNLFKEDLVTHDGIYLYEIERVEQLKSVYRRDWQSAYRNYEEDIVATSVAPQLHPTNTEKNTNNMFRKNSIPADIIQQINFIPPETLEAHGVITPAKVKVNGHNTYICPECANGKGDKGDGLVVYQNPNGYKYKCYKCGEYFGNFQLLGKYFDFYTYGKDFVEICKRACRDFGINYDFESDINMTENDLIKSDIETAHAAIFSTTNAITRGLTITTLDKYHCGFLDDWTTPKSRIADTFDIPTPRLIIPSGTHYLARLTVPVETFDEKTRKFLKDREKLHAGKKSLFGIDFITSDTKIVIATEGEIDAMSIDQVINSKAITPVATSGAAEKKWVDLFAKKCSQLNIKPKILILFDNDDAGKTNAPKRADELIKRGYPAVVDFLSDSDEKIDANDILRSQGEIALAETIQKLIQKRGADLDKLATQIEDEKAVKAAQYLLTPEQYDFIFKKLDDTSDLFNAKRLAYLWHNEIRYLSDTDNWANYDKERGIWIINPNSKNTALNPFVEKTAEILSANAKTDFDEKVVAAFRNQRKYSPAITTMKGNELLTIRNEDFNRRKTIVKVVGGRKIAVTNRDLNTHKHLLNCENCVVDLQTGDIYDHSPDYNWTQFVRAEYRAGYHNEIVDKFLSEIQPDPETLEALLLFFGYSITGECCEEKFLFMDGTGGNGKGTLTGLMLYVMNNYGCSFPIEGILFNSKIDANAATPAYNMLDGKRVSISEEIPANIKLNAAKIKILTGGDRIPIRRLHEEYSVIEDPTHTMIFSGNNLPEIGDVHDPGILRRLCRIIFKQDFRQNPNTKLKQQLLSADCRAGFLTVLVEHALKWYDRQKTHNSGLIVSNEMQLAVQSYIESQDFIASFIEEFCERGRNLKILRKDFLKKLQEEYPKETRGLSDRNLTAMVEKIDGVSYKRLHGPFVFCGIGWRNAPEQQSLGIEDNAPEELTPDVDLPF